MTEPTFRVAIVWPSHEQLAADFAYDFASLCAFVASSTPDTWLLGMHSKTGTYVHEARNALMADVLAQGYDAVLWLDSDMRFPRDVLFRLLKHDVPVVGINYSKRALGEGFTAIKVIDGPFCETTDESEGLEQVESLGFGCILIRPKLLKGMPNPDVTPWFQHKHLGGKKWMGEDVFFCELLKEAGIPVYVDHDLSKECKHLGMFPFECPHALIGREVAA